MKINKRILIVDDNTAIHEDFRKILNPSARSRNAVEATLNDLESKIFTDDDEVSLERFSLDYELDYATQGRDAFAKVIAAEEAGDPYGVIFSDVRMPPGIDGVLLAQEIWKLLPLTQIVIVSAFSDYSWEEIVQKLGLNDRLVVLRKPFDSITIKQLALAFSKKWTLEYEAELARRRQKEDAANKRVKH